MVASWWPKMMLARQDRPMSSRSIGRLVSISNGSIVGELFDDLGSYVNTSDGTRFVGEVGAYVTIRESSRTVIAEIVGVSDQALMGSGQLSRANNRRQVILGLLGEIVMGSFSFGVSKMPQIYSDISIISEADLRIMLEVDSSEEQVSVDSDGKPLTRLTQLEVGRSVVFPDYAVRVSIDRFFGGHFAVFGNTGAGKSNTVARLIQTIFSKEDYSARGARIIIIDSNGEYSKALSDITKVNRAIEVREFTVAGTGGDERFVIPVWALTPDDWAIMLHASEKTQLPLLRRAVGIARLFYGPNGNDTLKEHMVASAILGVLRSSDSTPSKADKSIAILSTFGSGVLAPRTIDAGKLRQWLNVDYGKFRDEGSAIAYLSSKLQPSLMDATGAKEPVPYTLEEFVQAVEFAVMYEGSVSTARIQEYTATLLTRLQSLAEGVGQDLLDKTTFTDLDSYLDDLLGTAQVVNIDISSVDDASGEVVTKVLAKLLLDHVKLRPAKAERPINLVVEEAHRYIKNEISYGAVGYDIFERLAKEGRKYGLLLGVSSQRPSELSKTVVSQCSNFIIHRVQNPDDLQYLSRMVPYVNRSIIERLTYLQTGTALVFGTAINLPTLTRIEAANPPTDSASAHISEKWYVE